MRKSWKWLHMIFPARSLLREILCIHLRVVPGESENHCNETASIGEMGDKSKGLFIINGILLHKSLSYKACFIAFNRAIWTGPELPLASYSRFSWRQINHIQHLVFVSTSNFCFISCWHRRLDEALLPWCEICIRWLRHDNNNHEDQCCLLEKVQIESHLGCIVDNQ